MSVFKCFVCPEGYNEVDGRCFFTSDVERNFNDAKEDCQNRGGSLVEIDDAEDREDALEGSSGPVSYWISRESEDVDFYSEPENFNCYICEAPEQFPELTLVDQDPTLEDERALEVIKSGKVPGIDGIPPELLKVGFRRNGGGPPTTEETTTTPPPTTNGGGPPTTDGGGPPTTEETTTTPPPTTNGGGPPTTEETTTTPPPTTSK
ncbi:ADP-ribosylation factor-like protein 13B [Branchiostoma belcheri]|nr:ADP-ribosylation factor-like protein 13B [Branchiostoma belcheri]